MPSSSTHHLTTQIFATLFSILLYLAPMRDFLDRGLVGNGEYARDWLFGGSYLPLERGAAVSKGGFHRRDTSAEDSTSSSSISAASSQQSSSIRTREANISTTATTGNISSSSTGASTTTKRSMASSSSSTTTSNTPINETPFFCMLLSTLLWSSYGFLKEDIMLLCINGLGLLLSAYYLRLCYRIMLKEHHESWERGASVATAGGSSASAAVGAATMPLDAKKRAFFTKVSFPVLIWLFSLAFCFLWNEGVSEKLGIVCVGATLVLFASPLSELKSVLQNQDASSISGSLTVTQILNCLSWLLYGMMVDDVYVVLPNLIGMVLGMLALLVKVMVGSGSSVSQQTTHKQRAKEAAVLPR